MMSMRCMVTLVDSVIAASSAERRSLIDDLVDSVNILPDRLTDHVAVAPLFLVTLQEVGLTWVVNPWCRRPDVTRMQPCTGGWPADKNRRRRQARNTRSHKHKKALLRRGPGTIRLSALVPLMPPRIE